MKVKLKRVLNFRLTNDCNGNIIGEITYTVGGVPDKILLWGDDSAIIHTETDIDIPASMQVVAKEKPGLGYEVAIMPKKK